MKMENSQSLIIASVNSGISTSRSDHGADTGCIAEVKHELMRFTTCIIDLTVMRCAYLPVHRSRISEHGVHCVTKMV